MNVFEVIAIGLLAVTSLASFALALCFLWLVYDRGGSVDLVAAAKALRQVHNPNRAVSLRRSLSGGGEERGEE
jgi:hypothetical protein